MADPISIFGATASVISIIDVLTKSIGLLDKLRSQWKTADLALLSLTSQLGALNAALIKIHEWIESNVDELHHQLVMDLKTAIDCCQILASKIHDEVVDLQKAPGGALLITAKARFTFKRNGLSELQSMIDRQTSTLTLLLTACNSKSLAKQQEILSDSTVRKRINASQRDTASLMSIVDSASFLSRSTERSSKLSMLFDFNEELFTSKPYKTLIRKTVKFSIRSQRQPSLLRPSRVMGDVTSNAEGRAPQISRNLTSGNVRKPQNFTNMLLLGPGDSSKTTFLKQMQSIHSSTNLTSDWLGWRGAIYDDLRTAFRTLLSAYHESSISLKGSIYHLRTKPRATSMLQLLDSEAQDNIPSGFAEIFETLLDNTAYNPSSSKALEELPETISYFGKHLKRVCAHDYHPSTEDVLHARVRTTGIHKHVFHIDDYEYSVYDVGGERVERRKWPRLYEGSPLVIVFVPMSCYDQFLYEDNTVNRMQDALQLFGAGPKSDIYKRSKVLLCFTKMDVFERKIRFGSNQINGYFPDYPGPSTDAAAVRNFITGKFTDCLETPQELGIFYINATDTADVRTVLASIFDDVPPSPPHFTFSKQAGLATILE